MRIAAVDGPDQQHLTAVKIWDWDRSYNIPSKTDPKTPAFLRHLGLARYPDRWVDVQARPDIQEGEPFPFKPEKVS